MFSILFLAITCLFGVMAAYATQRFQFPLQDAPFAGIDDRLGLDWLAFVLCIDDHPAINNLLSFAYDTMPFQIALPAVILPMLDQFIELREYLLAFSLPLLMTTVIAMFLPAVSYIVSIDRSVFHSQVLRINTGSTPHASSH